MKDIQDKYQSSLYEVVCEFEDEKKEEVIGIKSESDLIVNFFEENKVSKPVKDIFLEYNK